MRPIKFRAWCNGEWFDRVLASQYEDGPCSLVWLDDSKKWVHHDGPICQFTGLYDSSGEEIYEGDILLQKNGDIGEVRFHKPWGAFYYSCISGKNDDGETVTLWGSHPFYNDAHRYTIIGNIYENPELAK